MSGDDYSKALGEFEDRHQEVQAMVKSIMEVAKQIGRNPQTFAFTNTPFDVPAAAFRGENGQPADAATWPDATRIMAVLDGWRRAFDALPPAWSTVPESTRRLLPPRPFDDHGKFKESSIVRDVVRK